MSKPSYYKTCEDCPIFNYYKAAETGDLSWLVVEGNPSKKDLQSAWQQIEQGVVEELLLDKDYVSKLNEAKRKAIMKANAALFNRIADKHRIEVEETMDKDVKKSTLYDALISLEKWSGMVLDEKKISVKKYLTYVRKMKEEHGQKVTAKRHI
ncbi:MAG TPA: hypothetical protein VFV37_11090 [Luteibaculaceae bacterium]|nr:hypothetical protein [Luteibaculaceae bacterium]